MKTLYPSALLLLSLLAPVGVAPFQTTILQQASASPTPTDDPLVEPPLPANATEYELGRNLYWHWCMTCHGDRGQGLTDEFRGIWEPDHQNCWGRGCHGGRQEDEGFPIPTVVPALVNEKQLVQFSSLQELADFLEATHPPQSPGVLESEEYHAIALFVFTMNGRPLLSMPPTNTPIPPPTQTIIPASNSASRSSPIYGLVGLAVLGAVVLAFLIKRTQIQT